MARRNSVTFSIEDLLSGAVGVIVGLGSNIFIGKALESQSESTREMAAKVIPVIKAIGGGYLAMQKKQSPYLRMGGAGMAAAGTIELGAAFAPEYIKIAGIGNSGSVFEVIGNTDLTSVRVELPSGEDIYGFDEPTVMGGEEVYASYGEEEMAL